MGLAPEKLHGLSKRSFLISEKNREDKKNEFETNNATQFTDKTAIEDEVGRSTTAGPLELKWVTPYTYSFYKHGVYI